MGVLIKGALIEEDFAEDTYEWRGFIKVTLMEEVLLKIPTLVGALLKKLQWMTTLLKAPTRWGEGLSKESR